MSHLETADLQIEFREFGKHGGNPVLFLHGWPDDASTWDAVVSRLADENLRMIVPTLRGFGGTVFLNDQVPRTANGILAMDAIALMDGLGIERFSVVGHDWGSNVAAALAVGWPDRISRIVMLASPPRLGKASTPSFLQAQRAWCHWFMATEQGAKAVAKDRVGFTRLHWEN